MTSTEPAKMGRPRLEVDFEQLKRFCHVGATAEECAAFLDMSSATLYERIKEKYGCTFPEFNKKYASGGNISLRRAQHRKAMRGDTGMLIWMGKQRLGQTDMKQVNVDTTQTIETKIPDMIEIARRAAHLLQAGSLVIDAEVIDEPAE